jgi:hypothetical protein
VHTAWITFVVAAAAVATATRGPGSTIHSCSADKWFCPGSASNRAEPAGFPWRDGPTIDSGPWSGGSAAATNLARFEPLVGGRWVAEGELGGGRRYSAERRYEWVLDRRFVRLHQRLTVDGVTVEEESTFGWDATENQLRMWSIASDGSFAEGRERPAEGENRWVLEGRTVGGRTGEWRITTLLIDPGSFSVLLEVRNGGGFEPAMTLAYRKVADTASPPDTTVVRPDTTIIRRDTTLLPRDES